MYANEDRFVILFLTYCKDNKTITKGLNAQKDVYE